jgi:hypothetical protein
LRTIRVGEQSAMSRPEAATTAGSNPESGAVASRLRRMVSHEAA